jgi:hypothetical protein
MIDSDTARIVDALHTATLQINDASVAINQAIVIMKAQRSCIDRLRDGWRPGVGFAVKDTWLRGTAATPDDPLICEPMTPEEQAVMAPSSSDVDTNLYRQHPCEACQRDLFQSQGHGWFRCMNCGGRRWLS